MPFYGSLESLLRYMPSEVGGTLQASDAEESGALEGIILGKMRCLADILADIQRDIGSRVELSERLTKRVEGHYLYLRAKLLWLYQWPLSGNRAIEQRRSNLEKQLDAVRQEQRAELTRCWQDTAKLKAEARRWLREYREARLRVALLGSKAAAGHPGVAR